MRGLDLNKINHRIVGTVSNKESLQKITPIQWDNDVLDGKKQVIITNAKKDSDNKCVKLEISYS